MLQRRLQEATQASSSQVKSAESRALNAENVVEELRARMGEIHRLTAPSPLPTLGVRWGGVSACFLLAAMRTALTSPHSAHTRYVQLNSSRKGPHSLAAGSGQEVRASGFSPHNHRPRLLHQLLAPPVARLSTARVLAWRTSEAGPGDMSARLLLPLSRSRLERRTQLVQSLLLKLRQHPWIPRAPVQRAMQCLLRLGKLGKLHLRHCRIG